MTWTGLHPRRYRWGYAVVAVTVVDGGAPRIVDSRHAWTKEGAENLADRLNREERRAMADVEGAHLAGAHVAGPPTLPTPWVWSVRRMADHPDR